MANEQMAFNAPLIAKLEAWGYEEKFSAPLAELINTLDSPSLALVERLSNDLTHVTERSYDLRVKVAALTDSLKHERHRAEQFAIENEKLLRDKEELSKKLQELTDLTDNLNTEGNEEEEEQVQLWRAQSMHQLQELESMNQALRATLNLHSCCAPHDSKEVKVNQPKGSSKITLTRVLAPRSNTPPLKAKAKGCKQRPQNIVNAADVKSKLLEDELHLWKEKHSLLEEKFQNVQKELSHIMDTQQTSSAVAKHGEELQSVVQHSSKVDVAINTEEASKKLEEVENKESNLQESTSEYCSVMDDLLSLFQDYEKELIGLAASNLSEIDILTRQRTSNKQLREVSITDQDYLENVMQELLGQLEMKSKPQGLMALCKDGANHKLNGLKEELDQTLGQRLINMMKSVFSFRDRTSSKVRSMKTKLEELRAVLASQASTISSLRTEIARKTEEISFIMDEKVVGEEALQASQLECSELASLIKEIDGSMVQLTTALATRTLERDQASEARLSTEQELRKRYSNLLSQLDEARNQVIRFRSELEERRGQHEKDRSQVEALSSELQNCTKRMETAERDVEQLKTLIIQLDITREELVGKLKVTTSKEQQAEKHITALEAEVGRLRGEVETRTAEVSHTCSLLEVLSRERDHLQSELSDLKGKLALEDANRSRLEELWTLKSEEHRAAAEELAALKCEHQLLKIDAAQMSNDNSVLMEDVRNMTDKVNQFHLALSLREKELEDVCNLYQSVCDENMQLKRAMYEVENQVQQQLFHQQTVEEMRQKAEEQVRLLDEENQRLLSDFKSLERQADFMTRSLNQQSGLLNDYENEKKALVSQLTATRVAINDLEAKLSTSVMEMTTLEEKHRKVSELLHDNMQEVERLSATASMEQERAKSLEHLLASLRAEELKLETANRETVSENSILKERISALQEQVNTLQITRNTQNQDIMRLQMSKNRIEGEENRRLRSPASYPAYSNQSLDSPSSQHAVTDPVFSKARIQELEERISSLTADLTKTTTLYKDCFMKLQKSESRFLELRKELDQTLGLLSKVDEERIQLQQKCAEWEGAALKLHSPSGTNTPIRHSPPDIAWMQQECHRLKKASSLLESSPEIVAISS